MMWSTQIACWKRWVYLVVLSLYLGGLAACDAPARLPGDYYTPESDTNRIERGMMDAADLPFGWSRRDLGVPDDAKGGIARYRDYQGPPRSTMLFVRAGQTIFLYPNEADSQRAYAKIIAEEIPIAYVDQWSRPSELDFSARADAITIGCISGVINDMPNQLCSFIARYGQLVTVIHAQIFDDRWLTMAQFRHLLERVDAKMEAIREPQTDALSTPAP